MKTRWAQSLVVLSAFAALALSRAALHHARGEVSPAMADFDLGPWTLQAASDATVGWSFTVQSPIEVASLGFFDSGAMGLSQPHLVGIWNDAAELLVSAQIRSGEGSPLIGLYRYADAPGTVLTPGNRYVIGATVPLGIPYDPGPIPSMDGYPLGNVDLGTVVTAQEIILLETALRHPGEAGGGLTVGPGTLRFPSHVDSFGGAFAPNFRFHTVPEPGMCCLLMTGSVVLSACMPAPASCRGPILPNAKGRSLR